MLGLRGPQAGRKRAATAGRPLRVPACNWTHSSSWTPPRPTPEPSNFSAPPCSGSGAPPPPRRRPRRNYLNKTDAAREPRNKQNGRLLAFGPKEKVNIEPKEAVSDKCLFERKPRLASKLYTSTQVSLSVAKTSSEKKEVSSKKIDTKVSFKNIKKKASSKSIKNNDISTNLQSDLWSSSFLKEITDISVVSQCADWYTMEDQGGHKPMETGHEAETGGGSKDAVTAKQEKNNEYCLQDIDDKLSESTDDGGEDSTNDEDEDSNPRKETRAPLELMAEFLRAEMGRDYHLAKKLCQMILIYEPENPEAKEFLTLIEEMLLIEKAQNVEEEEDSEDSSCESEGDSSEDSSEECEAGS